MGIHLCCQPLLQVCSHQRPRQYGLIQPRTLSGSEKRRTCTSSGTPGPTMACTYEVQSNGVEVSPGLRRECHQPFSLSCHVLGHGVTEANVCGIFGGVRSQPLMRLEMFSISTWTKLATHQVVRMKP